MVKGDVMWPLDMAHSISQDKDLCGTNYCLLLIYLISLVHELITNIKRYGPKMGKKFFNSHNTINKLDYKFIKDG